MQSGPDAFDKSRFITTFLTILGVIEILYSFKLVLEGKRGKEIPESSRLKFKEKFSTAVNLIQQFVGLMQKSNCLLKTWLTKTPVSHNNGEVTLLILVYISKRKDLPSVSNTFTAILLPFHCHFN